MQEITRFASLPALIIALSAPAAYADLKAADVWADWKSYMESTGYEITASEATSGGTLTVSDLSMSIDVSDDTDQVKVDIVMDELVFSENGDGSVSIGLPDTTGFDVETIGSDGEDVKVRIDVAQTAPAMTASGDPGDMVHDYSADSVTMRMGTLNVDGIIITEEIAKFVVTMNDMDYQAKTAVGDLRSIVQDMSVGAIDYDVFFEDPEGEGTFKLKGGMQGVAFAGAGELPLDTDTQDLNAMLNDGFTFDGTFSASGGNYDMTFNSPEGNGTINSTSTGGELRVAMDPGGIAYDVLQTGLSMNMLLPDVPLPISFSAAQSAVNMLIPVQKSDQEQDFALAVAMQDFAMSDMIWGLFDPAGQLPRDPATLVVDLSGKAKVLFDFLDPEQANALESTGVAPGELNALTLNKLELDAVGARLTGAGDFTFDNGDLVTFDGMPRPQGGVDLTLVGGNGLIDKLVGMGLLPEDQAMGARMMMGLFAVPGEGEDTLNSRIEVNEEGQVLANGQRLR